MQKVKAKLFRKFHAVCSEMKLSDMEKHAIVESYGHESSKDMDEKELIDAITTLLSQKNAEADTWRKRVIAVIGAFLRRNGYPENINNIKAIAVRASDGYDNFNKIPLSQLRALYSEFLRKNKTTIKVEKVTNEMEQQYRWN